MRNPINIAGRQSQAISRDISEQLRVDLGVEPELPTGLKAKVDELRRVDGRSSIVPDLERQFENKPSEHRPCTDTGRGDQSRFDWRERLRTLISRVASWTRR
jgi:hypothetical protein